MIIEDQGLCYNDTVLLSMFVKCQVLMTASVGALVSILNHMNFDQVELLLHLIDAICKTFLYARVKQQLVTSAFDSFMWFYGVSCCMPRPPPAAAIAAAVSSIGAGNVTLAFLFCTGCSASLSLLQ